MTLQVVAPEKSARLEAENGVLRREISDLREIVLSLMPSKLQALLFDGNPQESDGAGRPDRRGPGRRAPGPPGR